MISQVGENLEALALEVGRKKVGAEESRRHLPFPQQTEPGRIVTHRFKLKIAIRIQPLLTQDRQVQKGVNIEPAWAGFCRQDQAVSRVGSSGQPRLSEPEMSMRERIKSSLAHASGSVGWFGAL